MEIGSLLSVYAGAPHSSRSHESLSYAFGFPERYLLFLPVRSDDHTFLEEHTGPPLDAAAALAPLHVYLHRITTHEWPKLRRCRPLDENSNLWLYTISTTPSFLCLHPPTSHAVFHHTSRTNFHHINSGRFIPNLAPNNQKLFGNSPIGGKTMSFVRRDNDWMPTHWVIFVRCGTTSAPRVVWSAHDASGVVHHPLFCISARPYLEPVHCTQSPLTKCSIACRHLSLPDTLFLHAPTMPRS